MAGGVWRVIDDLTQAGVISLKSVDIARDDLWTTILERESECKEKNREHYKRCQICSSYHVFELFLLHTFFDNVKRAQVDEIRRQHAEACAKLLLEEEHQKKKQSKKPTKAKRRKERRNRRDACACACHEPGAPDASDVVPVVDAAGEEPDACSSGESGNDVSDSDERTDETQVSEGDDEVEEDRAEDENVDAEECIAHCESRQEQQRQQEAMNDVTGWTKQTSKKKAKKQAIKAEAMTAQAAVHASTTAAARPIATGDCAEAKRDAPTPSLKRHTPFVSEPREKHRKQDDGNHLCLNKLHDHHVSTSEREHESHADVTAKHSTAQAATKPTSQESSAAVPKQQSRPAKAPEPVVPGPPPPHFPYWSRHHHNVMPKNWVWKAKKEEPSAEAVAQARAKALEEERKRKERQEKISAAAAVLMQAIRETSDASDVAFLKQTLKEIKEESNVKFCCDCEFDDGQQAARGSGCTSAGCTGGEECSYSHFDGPSLFSVDPVLFAHASSSSPPGLSPAASWSWSPATSPSLHYDPNQYCLSSYYN